MSWYENLWKPRLCQNVQYAGKKKQQNLRTLAPFLPASAIREVVFSTEACRSSHPGSACTAATFTGFAIALHPARGK